LGGSQGEEAGLQAWIRYLGSKETRFSQTLAMISMEREFNHEN